MCGMQVLCVTLCAVQCSTGGWYVIRNILELYVASYLLDLGQNVFLYWQIKQ